MVAPGASPPALWISSFSVQNFRVFRQKTAFEMRDGVNVFHGRTGSGKSTALAAMHVFLRALRELLATGQNRLMYTPGSAGPSDNGEPLLSERDQPVPNAPTMFAADFGSSQAVSVQFAPAGAFFDVTLHWEGVDDSARRASLLQSLFPFGSSSRALAILDARRRPRWAPKQAGTSLLAPPLATQLYELSTSRVASDRDRWRSFASELASFPTFAGATISIEAGDPPELVIEHPGRVVLGLDELSSGEQELAALTAGLLLARAAIVAIEEPEMGLDVETQRLWLDVCARQRSAGFVRQLIFESHAVTFDGTDVVRFVRDEEGGARAESGRSDVDGSLREAAAKSGAVEAFVSREGYTKLPEAMQKEIAGGEAGARVWFLRGRDKWEAWGESELEAILDEEKTK